MALTAVYPLNPGLYPLTVTLRNLKVELDKALLFVTREPPDIDRIIAESDYSLFFNPGGRYAIGGGTITCPNVGRSNGSERC